MAKTKRVGTPWPCQQGETPCPCRCHAIAAARNSRDRSGQWDDWHPEHDALLLARLNEGSTIGEIIDAMDGEFKIRRSPDAIRARITQLGGSLRTGWRSQSEIAELFRVHPTAVAGWRTSGALKASRRGHSHWFSVKDADLEAFIRAQAGTLFDPSYIRDERLRLVAQVSARANKIGRQVG